MSNSPVWDVSGLLKLCPLCSLQREPGFVFAVVKWNLTLAATVLEGDVIYVAGSYEVNPPSVSSHCYGILQSISALRARL